MNALQSYKSKMIEHVMIFHHHQTKLNCFACTLCGNREHKTELVRQEVKSELINVENMVEWLKAVYNSCLIIM